MVNPLALIVGFGLLLIGAAFFIAWYLMACTISSIFGLLLFIPGIVCTLFGFIALILGLFA
jgi:hypothetical protein